MVFEQNTEYFGIFIRQFLLGFCGGRLRIIGALPINTADIGTTIATGLRPDIQFRHHHLGHRSQPV